MTKNAKMTSTGLTLTLLAVALTGCTGPGKATKAPDLAASGLSGKVVETMDAGGYTYIALEKNGTTTWVAAPVTKVSVGQQIKLLPGAEMTNFSSKALNRSFDKIVFSGGVDQIAPAKPAAPRTEAVSETDSKEPILIGKVVETMDAMSYTYIKLEKDGKTAWAAVPTANVAVGDEIELLPGTEMGKFTSKKLNRTFNSIYFASGVNIISAQAKPAAPPQKTDAAAATLPAGHPKTEAATAALPAGHPKVDLAAQPAPQAPVPVPAEQLISGKVVETADAGGYTYICLEKDGARTWAAVPPTKVSVGQELALTPGVTMNNFVSKSLNRTFDKILFSNGPQAR